LTAQGYPIGGSADRGGAMANRAMIAAVVVSDLLERLGA
jgi:hypothetical protein